MRTRIDASRGICVPEFDGARNSAIGLGMDPLHVRIRKIREAAGLDQTGFAEALGVSQGTVSRWEDETKPQKPGANTLKQLAKFARITVDELLGTAKAGKIAPVVGFVAAGAEMTLFSDGQGPFDYVKAPDGATDKTVAVEIRGTSLGEFFDGWLVFYDDVRSPVTDDLLGKVCVVGLDDGRIVVKMLKKGQLPGRFNLISMTEPPIYDVDVIWAAEVRTISQR